MAPQPVQQKQNEASGYTAAQEMPDSITGDEVLGALTVLFTGALAFFAFLTVRDSRKSSERQLRAYINLKEGGNRGGIEAAIKWKNFGQTPAYKLRYWVDAVKSDPLQPFPFKPPKKTKQAVAEEGEVDVGPQGEFTILKKYRSIQKPISDIRLTQDPVYSVFGVITYIDAFDVERKTSFCMKAVTASGEFGPFGKNNWST